MQGISDIVRRRAALTFALGTIMLPTPLPAAPEITARVRLGIIIADLPQQFLVLGLYGGDAPDSVTNFVALCDGKLKQAPGISYAGSLVSKIRREDGYLLAGTPAGGQATSVEKSIDSTGYVRSEFVAKADKMQSTDANALRHDRAGLVSMRRGGGAFEFALTSGAAPTLDGENVVVGEVLDGAELLDELAGLAVRSPSPGTALAGYASLLGLKAGVALGVAGIVGRTPVADAEGYGILAGRIGLGLGAATLVGGDDPRDKDRELAYRPLRRVRILSAKVL